MTNVVQQPASSALAQENFEDTVEEGVPFEVLEEHLEPETIDRIRDSLGEESTRVGAWGIRGAAGSRKVKDWDRLERGDVALFAANNEIFASGLIGESLHNPDLARELWGEDDEGNTWEWLYLLGEVETRSIPYSDYNRAVGYAENNRIRSFRVLSDEQSQAFLSEFPLHQSGSDREPQAGPGGPSELEESPALHNELVEVARADGLILPTEILIAVETGLSCQPLTLFAGATGTGKTNLAMLLDDTSAFTVEPVWVEGGWMDSSSAFGYISPTTQDFVPGPVLLSLLSLLEDVEEGEAPVLLLDEINVSPTHIYLAPLLASLERAHATGEQTSMVVAQSGLSDTSREALEQAVDLHHLLRLEEPGPFLRLVIDIPPELRVVGTLNFDASTEDLAPKVLSRSFVVWFEPPHVEDDLGLTARSTYNAQPVEDPKAELAWVVRELMVRDFPVNPRLIRRAEDAMDQAPYRSAELTDILLSGLVLPQLQTVMEGEEGGLMDEEFLRNLPEGFFRDTLLSMRSQILAEGMANLWLAAQ